MASPSRSLLLPLLEVVYRWVLWVLCFWLRWNVLIWRSKPSNGCGSFCTPQQIPGVMTGVMWTINQPGACEDGECLIKPEPRWKCSTSHTKVLALKVPHQSCMTHKPAQNYIPTLYSCRNVPPPYTGVVLHWLYIALQYAVRSILLITTKGFPRLAQHWLSSHCWFATGCVAAGLERANQDKAHSPGLWFLASIPASWFLTQTCWQELQALPKADYADKK